METKNLKTQIYKLQKQVENLNALVRYIIWVICGSIIITGFGLWTIGLYLIAPIEPYATLIEAVNENATAISLIIFGTLAIFVGGLFLALGKDFNRTIR